MKNKFHLGIDFSIFGCIFASRVTPLFGAIPQNNLFLIPLKGGIYSENSSASCKWVGSHHGRVLPFCVNRFFNKTMRANPKQCRTANQVSRISTSAARNAVNDLFLQESADSIYKAIQELSLFFDSVELSLSQKEFDMEEVWKDVVGYEGLYRVSSYGRLKSIAYRTNHLIKPGINNQGYATVVLTKNTIRTSFKVHRIVCLAFIGNPENKATVNHKDGIRSNNRITNLEWLTHLENIHHSVVFLNRVSSMQGKFGKLHHASIPVIQLSKEGVFIKRWESIRHVQRELKYSHSHISNVCRGKRISAYGYYWKFEKQQSA